MCLSFKPSETKESVGNLHIDLVIITYFSEVVKAYFCLNLYKVVYDPHKHSDDFQ